MRWGWILFWFVVLVILAPAAVASFFGALGPALTTFAHNLQSIFAGMHSGG